MRDGVVSFNYFPPGSLGGLVMKGRSRGMGGPDVSVSLFMPPVDAEVSVNVPGVRSRVRLVMPDNLRPVLEMLGPKWRMMVAGRDNHGANIWSPFYYANVHPGGAVCWGSRNAVPTQFVTAWDTFWSAPFNSDLMPAVSTSPLNFEQWLVHHGKVDQNAKRRARLRQQLTERVRCDTLSIAAAAGSDGKRLKYGDMLAEVSRRNHLMALAKNSGQIAAMGAGKTWVGVNDKAYMEAKRAYDELNASAKAILHELGVVENLVSQALEMLRGHAGHMSTITRDQNVRQARGGGIKRYYYRYYGRYHADDKKAVVDAVAAAAAVAEPGSPITQPGFLRRWYRDRMISIALDCAATPIASNADRQAYDDYYKETRSGGIIKHFADGAWTKALAMEPIRMDDVIAAFAPGFDGLAHVPKKVAPMKKLGSTSLPATVVTRDRNGVGHKVSLDGLTAFFRRVTDSVVTLHWPGSDAILVSDGSRFIECESEAEIGPIVAILEKPLEDFDPVAWLTKQGYTVNRHHAYDDRRKMIAAGVAGEASGGFTPERSTPAGYNRNRYLYSGQGPFVILPLPPGITWHEGHALERASDGNHCPCGDTGPGVSHAWCSSCGHHVCGSRGLHAGLFLDTDTDTDTD